MARSINGDAGNTPTDAMDRKVWNEDLVAALNARYQQAWQQKKKSQYMWKEGAKTIQGIRKDIVLTKTSNRIFHLPLPSKHTFTKTVYEECQRIIRQEVPIYPPGFVPLDPQQMQEIISQGNNHNNHNMNNSFNGNNNNVSSSIMTLPYLQSMKKHGGAYAILLAFYFSSRDTMTKDQICKHAQPYCHEEMEANWHQGRPYGAWKAKDTLVRHDLITEHKSGAVWTPNGFRSNGKHSYSITPTGKQFLQAMLEKWPDAAIPKMTGHNGVSAASALLLAGSGGGAGGGGRGGGNTSFASPFDDYSSSSSYAAAAAAAATVSRSPPSSPYAHASGVAFLPDSHGDFIFPGGNHTNTATSSGTTAKHAKSIQDEQDLREFIISAGIGEQKEFNISKERRQYLHNICDDLQVELPGLRLLHESSGTGRQRKLFVTIMRKPTSTTTTDTNKIATSSTLTNKKAPPSSSTSPSFLDRVLQSSGSNNNNNEKKRALYYVDVDNGEDDFGDDGVHILERPSILPSSSLPSPSPSSLGYRLGGGDNTTATTTTYTTPKSAKQAAAEAAMARLAASMPSKKKKQRRYLTSVTSSSSTLQTTNTPTKNISSAPKITPTPPHGNNNMSFASSAAASSTSVICIDLDDDGDIDIDDGDRKPPARKKRSIQRQSQAQAQQQHQHDSSSSNKPVAIVDLCDEFENYPIVVDNNDTNNNNNNVKTTTTIAKKNPSYSSSDIRLQQQQHTRQKSSDGVLTILIDDRERSRNATPRELRIELTKEIQFGVLNTVRPKQITMPNVIETKLEYGDFAFQLETQQRHQQIATDPVMALVIDDDDINNNIKNDAHSCRLSLVVERKRIADLVQRSKSGDHWKQLQRMRDCCRYAIMLIENDIKSASLHDVYGASNVIVPRPNHHIMETGQDIFRFMGRAILSSRAIKFIQTKDIRGTIQSIGSLGLILMAKTQNNDPSVLHNYTDNNAPPIRPPTAASQQQELCDRLVSGAIHWKIAKAVAFEVGSISEMHRLYKLCSGSTNRTSSVAAAANAATDTDTTTSACALALMQPIILGMERDNDSNNNQNNHRADNNNNNDHCIGSVEMWSEAIYYAFHSDDVLRKKVKFAFEELKEVSSDPAALVRSLYRTNGSRDDALDIMFSSRYNNNDMALRPKRHVHIEIPETLKSYFPQPTTAKSSFYSLITSEQPQPPQQQYPANGAASTNSNNNDNNIVVPVITFTTGCGRFTSGKMMVYIVEGKMMFDMILNLTKLEEESASSSASAPSLDYISIARQIAMAIHSLCRGANTNHGNNNNHHNNDNRHVIIIRGLVVAGNAAATKNATFREEAWTVADMVMSLLMMTNDHNDNDNHNNHNEEEYDYVILQAMRLKEETEMILQQLALSCFYYHLLTNEI